jgi:hypothetical protein
MFVAEGFKHVFAFLISGVVLLAPIFQYSASSASPDGKNLRFGIGMALLATEQCEGIVLGPKFKQLLAIISIGAKRAGETLDENALFDRSKKEAAATLAKAGKELCVSANKVASDDGVISRK